MGKQKNPNPYSEKSKCHAIFGFWKSSQVVTRQQLVEHGVELGFDNAVKDGKKDSPLGSMVTVLLSPRHESQTRESADCRGSSSAKGHLYYAEKLNGKKFRLRWREKALDPRPRNGKVVKATAEVVEDAEAEAETVEA